MLVPLEEEKLDDIMKLWLEVNIDAHRYISKQYWYNNLDYVRSALPNADVTIYVEDNEVKGFIGVIYDCYIAGLFIANEYQRKGVGKALIKDSQQKYSHLELDVYKKNEKAIRFYKKHGFIIIDEHFNEETNEFEYKMKWKK